MGNLVRGNFHDDETFVVIENETNRVTADGDVPLFSQVNVYERVNGKWREIVMWDSAEWREEGNEAFEAILGVIAKIANGERIERP